MKIKKIYWYFTYLEECPVCGQISKIKERIYNKKKPKNVIDRMSYKYLIHHCDI